MSAPSSTARSAPSLATVILTHADPDHLQRLLAALGPIDIFVHCDARTDAATFAAMREGAPSRVRWLSRRATPWGNWPIVEAELDGLAAAVAETDATHIATLQGSDYPLASTSEMRRVLGAVGDRSVLPLHPLPYEAWGRSGGLSRLRYRHRAWGRHMLRLPIPRRLPTDLRPGGSSVLKVLSRSHASAIGAVRRARPDLAGFFASTWAPDETFIPSLLESPTLLPRSEGDVIRQSLWFVDWGGRGHKSPRWLTSDHFDRLRHAADHRRIDPGRLPALFARKFSTPQSGDLLDRIDGELRKVAA